jgi:hypothetical protein
VPEVLTLPVGRPMGAPGARPGPLGTVGHRTCTEGVDSRALEAGFGKPPFLVPIQNMSVVPFKKWQEKGR